MQIAREGARPISDRAGVLPATPLGMRVSRQRQSETYAAAIAAGRGTPTPKPKPPSF